MRRLQVEDFREARKIEDWGPASAETLWDICYRASPWDDPLWTREEARALSDLLIPPDQRDERDDNFYYADPLAKLPLGAVLERINRAAEILGIIED